MNKESKKDKNHWMNTSIGGIMRFLKYRFDLNEDKADQCEVVSNISRSVEFRGTNLWILIFAIVVASVGLNVNSTAVIIGAMLISPLMGPIMGIGLSLGINDFELLKRSLRNFFIATVISLIVSMLYFMASPLTIAQSEILARTTPTIWDVLIATFGGLAGIVAQSRRDRTTTVIPGVAIATALMPPLCTAGYGLAAGKLTYFGGALYLFFINAVFIALAAFVVVRFLKYDKVGNINNAKNKRVQRLMATIVLITVIPSILMAYNLVQRSIFENSAQKFITEVFNFKSSQVVNKIVNYDRNNEERYIEVVMIGEPISGDAIEAAQNQLPNYSLAGTTLKVRQATNKEQVTNEILEDVLKSNKELLTERNNKIKELETRLATYDRDTLPTITIARELGSLWPEVESVELSRSRIVNTSGELQGSIINCTLHLGKDNEIDEENANRIKRWLTQKTGHTDVRLTIDVPNNVTNDSTSTTTQLLILE